MLVAKFHLYKQILNPYNKKSYTNIVEMGKIPLKMYQTKDLHFSSLLVIAKKCTLRATRIGVAVVVAGGGLGSQLPQSVVLNVIHGHFLQHSELVTRKDPNC